MEFAYKYMGLQYRNSLVASSQNLPIPPVALHVRKRWKQNTQVSRFMVRETAREARMFRF